jgi:ankyrin repeat protein
MTTISFQEAVRAYKDGDYQIVTDYIEQGNPLLQFNGDDLIEVELIYLVSSSSSLNNSIKDLISKGIDLNETTTDQDRYSAVHFAAWDNKSDILEYLIKSGADPNMIGKDGLSPLYLACVNGNYQSVKCLVDNGAEINHLYNGIGIEGLSDYFSEEGGTVLRGALINIELEIAQYLINGGADVMELKNPCKGVVIGKDFLPTNDFFELIRYNYLNNPNLQSSVSKENFSELLTMIQNITQE